MKIALVSPYDFAYPGGVTAHIDDLGREFLRLGHDVKIIAPSSKSPSSLGLDNLIRLGVPVPVPSNGSVARISLSLWLIPKIKALLKRENFDVIHLHNPYTPLLPLLVLRFSRSLNIGTFHGFHEEEKRYLLRKRILRGSFERLHGCIAVSPPAREFMNRYFRADYQVIPNTVDVDHFASPASPIPELMDGKINLLFVGRMEKRKGLKYLLRAYSRLKWDYPDLRLVVVGPGTPDKESFRIIGERNLRDVVFTGAVSYSELPGYYQAAHIFCAPNTGRESFGIVLLEAMAAGKPVVGSDIEGFASVVDHGVQGILVPPKDDQALADALRSLLESPSLQEKLVAAGKSHVQQYRVEQVAPKVLDFYETTRRRVEDQTLAAAPPAA